uniref:hypothetical protein n=1 Tax=Pantoea sp. GbtcB22 TaxID=2824767 RepID=UPI001C309075
NFSFQIHNLTNPCPMFTKINTGYLSTIPKLFAKDQLKKTTGLAGILDLAKEAIFGQRRGKLKSDLLVAIQQD